MSTQRCSGFTMIEIVVALTISAVLAGVIAMLISEPIEAYIDQSERTELTYAAESIARTLSADLRQVLPNSVRIENSGARSIIEMLQIEATSFHVPAGAYGSPQPEYEFDSTHGDTFRVYGPFADEDLFLVTGHSGAVGASAYEMQNVIVSGFDLASVSAGAYEITLPAGFSFTNADSLRRMFWVTVPVTYICNNASGSLSVYRGYSISSNIAVSEASPQLSGASAAVLATHLRSCNFDCESTGAGKVCQGRLKLEATLVRPTDSGEEIVNVFEQLALDNRT